MALPNESTDIEAKCVNTIRALSMDAVQKANSGHPGTPMALAPLAHVLYTRILRHDPTNPTWYNRDRLILSAGHASMLLYSTLHLTGYDISLDDIKEFRQYNSKTPGHPEVHHTPGIEVTTGPLGQGFANAVGMAIAEEHLREKLGSEYVDHNIFVICSDGDLMEGISYEAASIAGHNKLSKIVAIYDDNKITIDGSTDLSFSEDVASRFRSQGWNVIEAGEIAEDLNALENVLNQAKNNNNAPTLIVLRSHIGYPSPKFTDTSAAHGAPLGDEEIEKTKEIMGISKEPFTVDADVTAFYKALMDRYTQEAIDSAKRLDELATQGSDVSQLASDILKKSPATITALSKNPISQYFKSTSGEIEPPKIGDKIATRASCAQILSSICQTAGTLIGGSADLTGNTGTKISDAEVFHPAQRQGRQIHFGIREHAMGASAVAMALSYNLRPFVGTFFVFADYMRPTIRLAALTKAPVLFVFSHDSVGVGEDGPTHQPIEHLAALRAIPGLNVVRPADGFETAAAIEQHLINSDSPTALILTRQAIPTQEGSEEFAREGVDKGAYIVADAPNPDIVLVGTGSEVHLCVEAAEILGKQEKLVRVVSMPNMKRFLSLSKEEKQKILGKDIPVISVEAGSTFGWAQVTNINIGINDFGTSAPGDVVFEKYGITAQAIVERAIKLK